MTLAMFAGALVQSAWAAVGDVATDNLPKDHPIFAKPRLDDPKGLPPSAQVRMSRDPGILPTMDFRLSKDRALLGEPIEGKWTVRNPNKKNSFRLSPPYRGAEVVTVGVWISSWEGKWTPLRAVFPVNRGFYRFDNWQFQGLPIELAPEAKYETTFAISGGHLPYFSGPRKWSDRYLAGVGFSKPGKYRFYLQYVNLVDELPFEYRRKKSVTDDKATKIGDKQAYENGLFVFPETPQVLGPFDVEVLPLGGKVPKDVNKLLQEFDRAFEVGSPKNLYSVPVDRLEKVVQDTELKTKELVGVRAALMLSLIQAQRCQSSQRNDKDFRRKLLEQLRDTETKLSPGALRNAYGLTVCQSLFDLGQAEDSFAAARKLGTPDAQVFLADFVPTAKGERRN